MLSGFPPVAAAGARLLILGSMPGVESLRQCRYYAHPRNAFWAVIGELCGVAADESYEMRCRALIDHGIALWDVIAACHRPGSLDSSIDQQSLIVNDFADFLRRYTGISAICFNGKSAAALFRRHVIRPDRLSVDYPALYTLPSTSPANARIGIAEKIRLWCCNRCWQAPRISV